MEIDLDVKPGAGGDEGDDGARGKDKGEKRARRDKPRQSRADSARVDRELHARLEETLGRVAEERDARGDDELAEIIREDAGVMAQGIVRLSRPIPPLRAVITFFVAFIEPILAFRRVVRVVLGRYVEWRTERATSHDEDTPPAA